MEEVDAAKILESIIREHDYRRGYQQSVAFVIRLMEHGATLDDLREWERLLWNWRHDVDLSRWFNYLRSPKTSRKPKKPLYFEIPENIIHKSKRLKSTYNRYLESVSVSHSKNQSDNTTK